MPEPKNERALYNVVVSIGPARLAELLELALMAFCQNELDPEEHPHKDAQEVVQAVFEIKQALKML